MFLNIFLTNKELETYVDTNDEWISSVELE